MKVSDVCRNYFNVFNEVLNYKKNDSLTNALAILKILSYFTLFVSLGFATAYGTATLCKRISKKPQLSNSDHNVSEQAKRTIIPNAPPAPALTIQSKPKPLIPILPPKAQQTTLDPLKPNLPPVEPKAQVSKAEADLAKPPKKIELSEVLSAYDSYYTPAINGANLQAYSNSEDYQRHARTARIYYNSSQLAAEDALRIIYQREPTNIAMGENQYNKEKLKQLFGYEVGVYNDATAKKMDGSSFKALPNTAAVYSETYLWDTPGEKNEIEVACLSLPAQALDSAEQPHYAYYMRKDPLDAKKYKLDADNYETEMAFLFKIIEQAIKDNKNSAFDNKGIKRVVLSKFGQGAFLEALSAKDQKAAQTAYRKQMAIFLHKFKDTGLKIVMSEYVRPDIIWHDKMIVGDILKKAEAGDLIVNAWDPHSAPGNGNDGDCSFDGALGKGTGILLTQTSWLNETLKSKNSLVAVE